MSAGNIGAWQKKAGDSLQPGDVLVEIETDKAQMDFEFQDEGVLAKVLKETGEKDVSVGAVSDPFDITMTVGGDDRLLTAVPAAHRCFSGGGYRCCGFRVVLH